MIFFLSHSLSRGWLIITEIRERKRGRRRERRVGRPRVLVLKGENCDINGPFPIYTRLLGGWRSDKAVNIGIMMVLLPLCMRRLLTKMIPKST